MSLILGQQPDPLLQERGAFFFFFFFFFFLMPLLNGGSMSLESLTREPGSILNGAMNSASRRFLLAGHF